jgi:hypothetical protein
MTKCLVGKEFGKKLKLIEFSNSADFIDHIDSPIPSPPSDTPNPDLSVYTDAQE